MNYQEALNHYKKFLKQEGMLYTQERVRILKGVYARQDHFSADDLLFHMRQDGLEVSRATLYRNLKLLTQAGILEEADFGHGHIHYERVIENRPHEHLICSSCGAIEEVSAKDVRNALHALVKKRHFSLESYHLRITGLCQNCQAKQSS